MNKLLLKLNFIFFLIGFLSSAQDYIVDNDKLKGNVKSIDIFIIEYGNKEKPVEQQTFDIKGRPLITKKYSEGYLRSEERNQYNPNQIITTLCESCGENPDRYFSEFLIKENQKDPYSGYGTNDPSARTKTFKTPDKKGNIILEKFYNSEGYLISTSKSVFNLASKKLSTENYSSENELLSSSKNVYNKSNLITETHSKSKNEPELKLNYSYDNQGRLILEKQNYNNSISETLYEYLKVQDTTKILKYSSNLRGEKRLHHIEKSYSQLQDKIVEKQNIFDNKLGNKRVYEYDENKKLTALKYINEQNESIKELHYTYDTTGNWNEINISETINVIYDKEKPRKEIQKTKYIRRIEYY